ncbi:hypothetical protein N474_07475 [Pseudoalteromonas luteoviolacea CPMOR-2]|uniref:Uncharacterized protein n=1 Tax=Pseudoalteromonas luteoviolacea DSM 6061 TaxID=1365250 RepID=A0A166X312_9GAMM|nr:hypothetical protein [Pseudoalteromonas luteoviolacea]KZN39543.1 hypothetical protein N475_14085 [Pseudoalteromonas luteoviolacea DSM 6061]KZN57812.1 hypothetical protein N474_07475 [Pseudoalteromonas luteoviolacea CPMOR-2]MBE0388406.1 hypothetical protein [Pseudoalteromonas luteoviolacea DSM 6061]
MKLRFLQEENDISEAQKKLASTLNERLKHNVVMKLSYRQPEGTKVNSVEVRCNQELYWYHEVIPSESDVTRLRHWNAFGVDIFENTTNPIVAEINSPVAGYDGRISGAFAYDLLNPNKLYLVHSGRFSGRKAADFTDRYKGIIEKVKGPNGYRDMVVVGELTSTCFYEKLLNFVDQVKCYKELYQIKGVRVI